MRKFEIKSGFSKDSNQNLTKRNQQQGCCTHINNSKSKTKVQVVKKLHRKHFDIQLVHGNVLGNCKGVNVRVPLEAH